MNSQKKCFFITLGPEVLLMSVLLMAISILSCSGSDGPDNATSSSVEVSVSAESLSAPAAGSTLDLMVKANNAWAIQSNSSWATVRPSGGVKDVESKVTITVSANTTLEPRTAVLSILCGGQTIKTVTLQQDCPKQASPSVKSLTFGGHGGESPITITANADWTLSSDAEWLTVSPAKGGSGDAKVGVKVAKSNESITREAHLTLQCGEQACVIDVVQLSDEINVPEGYTLVWNDEFNEGTELNPLYWTHEVQKPGWVNNELQHYANGQAAGQRVTEVKDGFLTINCFKGTDGNIYSGRVYANVGTGWTYGYFEARICLPSGKGTWPAFWMMPVKVDWSTNPWPKCGEIDIMEEVGYNPDMVSSSLHTQNYNHTKGTQKTHEMKCAGAEGGFHTYALEWTEDEITTYVDGKVQLHATKASMGDDHDSWPFHYAFYPILNLAWGGSWGGSQGVEESALPVAMKVDYIRVFQKR